MNIISKAYLVFSYFLLGSIIGVFVGIGASKIQETSIFLSWELLDSPFKFIEIDAGFLSFPKIVAKSIEEKHYTWAGSGRNECQWVEIQDFELFAYDDFIQKEVSCNLLKQPPQRPAQQSRRVRV
jgi:hypothetical protein